MMSGLLPQQHGADGFGKSRTLTNFSLELPLVHRLLQVAGWTTAAFVTNPFLREWNAFHRGFDTFRADFVRNPGNTRVGFHEFGTKDMFADKVNESVFEHFDASPPSGPEFTYVHYIDAHGPWTGAPFPGNYPDSIRFVDARTAELHEYFHRRYDGDVLFLLTSDHGRAMEDDLQVGYGRQWRLMKESIHDFNVRIPFVVLPGNRVPEGRTVTVPCSSVDFAPTVLDVAGLSSSVPLAGESLAPYLGPAPPGDDGEDRPIYIKVSAFGTCQDAVVVRRKKYARYFECETGRTTARRVFDLERDPRETVAVSEDFGAVESVLLEMAGDRGLAYETSLEPLTGDLEERLRALGYVD
jgi:hypothetical protein